MSKPKDTCQLGEPLNVFAFDTEPPEPLAKTVGEPPPGKGVFFDHHIDLREPEGGRLTKWLLDHFNRQRDKQRLRDQDTWKLRLRKVAANAMRGHFYRDPPSTLYSRGAASQWYQDKPGWMKNGGLKEAIDPLIEAGLLDGHTGKALPHNHAQKSWTASFWATGELIEKATDCGITAGSIVPDVPENDLVQLFAPKPKCEFDRIKGGLVQPRKGKRIRFDPTPESDGWCETLSAINSFY